jgi:hypothetical protein
MVVRERIQRIRKQSRIAHPTSNLWFFNEANDVTQSQVSKRISVRNDRVSLFNEDYTHYGKGNNDFRKTKKECPFVVDWQMSDAF